jgi:hypothetical protein
MSFAETFRTHHTEISLVVGPLLALLIGLLPKVPVAIRALLFIGLMYFAVGIWGILLNWWLLLGLSIWYAVKQRLALGFLRIAARVLAVLLLGAAIVYYGFLLFTNPGEVIGNLWNPLLYLYLVPGVLAWLLADHVAEIATHPVNSTGTK